MKNLNKPALLLAVSLTALLVSAPTFSEPAYLYVFFHDDNSNGERFRTELPDLSTCLKVLESAKMPMPTNPSGDYEVMGAMWCGTKTMHRNYNATWWNDEVKESSKR